MTQYSRRVDMRVRCGPSTCSGRVVFVEALVATGARWEAGRGY